MKIVSGTLGIFRPLFEPGGKLAIFRPVYRAIENFFFLAPENAEHGPFARDPLDLKRYMSMVIIGLLPAFAASLYFFGWRVLLMILVSYIAGGIVEVIFAIVRKEDIAEGFLVTGFIFPLTLPPGTPLWMVAVGIMFGVLVGKEIFGGTGRNLFNPALLGRCFLSFAYPAKLAGSWVEPGTGWFGSLLDFKGIFLPDAVSTATPLALAKGGVFTPLQDLFFGNVTGSIGETSALAILAGGAFLVLVGVANWRTVAGALVGFLGLQTVLWLFLPQVAAPVPFSLLAGGILFGAFFMATDPVTSPLTQGGRWVYGLIVGTLTVLIRTFAGYVEGVTFAILLGNIAAPAIDEVVIRMRMRRYAREG